MKKSYFRRPLATLLSLLMVIGMFTICGFSVLAEDEATEVILKSWSIDDLEAAAVATNTKNANDHPVYHRTPVTVGAQRNSAGWLFHSQGLTNSDGNSDGQPDVFKEGETLRIIAYLKGELGTAEQWGTMEVVLDNNNDYRIVNTAFTQEVIDAMEDAPEFGEGAKKYVVDVLLEDKKTDDSMNFSTIGKFLQTRINVANGATLACYGVEYVNLTADRNRFSLDTTKLNAGSGEAASFITRDALVTYTSHNAYAGANGANGAYTTQPTFDKNTQVKLPIFSDLGGEKLAAGNYTFDLDFALHQMVDGATAFYINIYAGDELIATKGIGGNSTFTGEKKWGAGSRITRRYSVDFTVSEENSRKPITYEVAANSFATLSFYGAQITTEVKEGAALALWDYKDLWKNSSYAEMTPLYDKSETVDVGIKYVGGGNFDGSGTVTIPNIEMTKGHTVRYTQKIFGEKGWGTILWRIYQGGVKFADDQTQNYNSTPVQYSDVFGAYKEVSIELEVEAETGTYNLQHWLCSPSLADFSTQPLQIFEFKAYDVTAGKELYTLDGAYLAANYTSTQCIVEKITVPKAGYDRAIGFRAVEPKVGAPTAFAAFDCFIPATDVAVGDEIEVGVWFWLDNGIGENAGCDLNSKIRLAPGNEIHGGSWRIATQEDYDAIETQYDSTYGFAYKEKVLSYELNQEQVDILSNPAALGFNLLFGDSANAGHDWANYPLTTYRYWIYNKTQDKYYGDLLGDQIMSSGGSGTINETISAFVGKDEYMNGASVNAGGNAVYQNLILPTPMVANYSMKFDVTGKKDAEYTVAAYYKNGSSLTEVGSKTFTAAGEDEIVILDFDAYAPDSYLFGISAATDALEVRSASIILGGEPAHTEAIDEMIAAINNLPETVTLEDAEAIQSVRAAYDALISGQKAMVTNTELLTAAEAKLAVLLQEQETITTLIDAIDNFELNTYSHTKIKKLQAAYKALSEEKRALVTNYAALEQIISDHEALLESDEIILPDEMEQKPIVPEFETAWVITNFDSSAEINGPGADQRFPTVNGNETFMAYYVNTTEMKVMWCLDEAPVKVEPISITDYTREELTLYMQVYVEDADAVGGAGQVEITSGGDADAGELYWATSQLHLKDGWNEVYLPLSKGAETPGSYGPFDLTNIDYFRVYFPPNDNTVIAYDQAMIVTTAEAATVQADKAESQKIIDRIATLPEDITVENEAAVTAAREAYEALTDAQKDYVNNLDELEAAEKTITDIKNAKPDSDAVIAKINALPAVDSVTLENEAAVNEAKTAYDALSSYAKALVSESLVAKLNDIRNKIAALKADKDAADAVIAKINALPAADAVTESDKASVQEARAAYDALTEAQKALVSEDTLKKLTDVEKALAVSYGDVNNDGEKNATDALMALQHSVKLITLNETEFAAANVDGNEEVNASDALYILQYSVKLITKFPVEQ